MSNVSNPSGPINPTNPQRSSEPAKPGTDKFRDLMKIDKSDEKQKKRKKRQEEIEEEEKARLQTGAEIAAAKNAEAAKKPGKLPKVQKVGEGEKKQPQHQKRPEEISAEEAATMAAAPQKKPFEPIEAPQKIGKETISAAQLHEELDQIIQEEQEVLQKEEISQDIKQTSVKVDQRKTEQEKPSPPSLAPSSSILAPSFLSPATEVPPAYALLSAEAFALFEKMVSMITLMQEGGLTETIIHLNTHEFLGTPFSGAQIIIREYSTSPLTYNIELVGNPLAADLFRKNIPFLRTAFDEGKHRFRIHRLESSLAKDEPPKVQRKGKHDSEEG